MAVFRFTLALVITCAVACDGEDARPDGDPDDLDGDGIANADDNCERATNIDQHDEDGDAIGDACDNCPTAPNPTQMNSTELAAMSFEDDVGDACDFRPALSGDTIGALHTFADPAQMTRWLGSGWAIVDDELVATSDARWSITRGESGDGIVVVARIESLAWTGALGNAVSIAIDGDGIDSGAVCTLRPATGGDELVTQELGGSSSVIPVDGGIPGEPQSLVAWRRLTSQRNELACRVIRGTRITETSTMLADDLITGAYAIAASGASVSVSSVIVYSSPGPKDP